MHKDSAHSNPKKPVMRTGITTAEGEREPAIARSPITVVGISCTEQVLNKIKRHISGVGYPSDFTSLSSSSIAARPEGVAALPMPNMFAEMFTDIFCKVF